MFATPATIRGTSIATAAIYDMTGTTLIATFTHGSENFTGLSDGRFQNLPSASLTDRLVDPLQVRCTPIVDF